MRLAGWLVLALLLALAARPQPEIQLYRQPSDRPGIPVLARIAALVAQRPEAFTKDDVDRLRAVVGVQRSPRLQQLRPLEEAWIHPPAIGPDLESNPEARLLEAQAMARETRLVNVLPETERIERETLAALTPRQRTLLQAIPEAADSEVPIVWPKQGLDLIRLALKSWETGEAVAILPEPTPAPATTSGTPIQRADDLTRRGYFRKAMQILDEARRTTPGPDVEQAWRRVSLLADPSVAARLHPRDAADLLFVHEARVTAAMAAGDLEALRQAIPDARAGITPLVDDPALKGDAHAVLAALDLIQQQWASAADHFEQALQAGVPNPYRELDVHMGLAYAALRMNRPEDARAHFQQALDLLRDTATPDYVAALGLWEQLHLYRRVYLGDRLRPSDLSQRDALYGRMRRGGVRNDSPSFIMRSKLEHTLLAPDPWAALAAWEGPASQEDILSGGDEVHSIFGYCFHIPLLSHAETLLYGDLHRAIGDEASARQFYRDALRIFPESALTRARLSAGGTATPPED